MSKRTYEEPSAQVLYLKLETLICASGNGEDIDIEDPVTDLWAVSISPNI